MSRNCIPECLTDSTPAPKPLNNSTREFRSIIAWIDHMGLSVGSKIISRVGDAPNSPIRFYHWNEYRLQIKWIGEKYVIWTYEYRSDNSPTWEAYGEVHYNSKSGVPLSMTHCSSDTTSITERAWYKA